MENTGRLSPAYPVLAALASFFFVAMLFFVTKSATDDTAFAPLELLA